MARAYGQLPLRFEPNLGQSDAQVRFLARGSGYSLFLTPTEAVLALSRAVAPEPEQPHRPARRASPRPSGRSSDPCHAAAAAGGGQRHGAAGGRSAAAGRQ